MEGNGNGIVVHSWFDLADDIRGEWERRIDLLVPAPPLMTEIAGPHFTIDNYDPKALADSLSHDPLLVGRMLSVVNSAKFGQVQQVTNLERAMIILGFNMVKSIIISFMLDYKLGSDLNLPADHVDHVRRWTAGASVIAYRAASELGLDDPATISTAAMLARVGTLLYGMDDTRPGPGYREQPSERSRIAYELETWQVTSSQLSCEMVLQWQLPDPLPDLIQQSWLPVAKPISNNGDVADVRELTCIAASLAFADHYLRQPTLELDELLTRDGYSYLNHNLVSLKMFSTFEKVWESKRLMRELSSVVE